MDDFYSHYYNAIAQSRANASYCEQLFGRDLGQHGFAELSHLDHLFQVTGINSDCRVLDLGCGNGGISTYIAEQTGAQVTGIDFVPVAIAQAQARPAPARGTVDFHVMDIANLCFPAASFDVILALDTLYFTPLDATLRQLTGLLRPDGRIGAFYSQGCEPWVDPTTYPREKLHPQTTDLAQELTRQGLTFQTWDYSAIDYDHACRKKAISEALKPDFEAEGNSFLLENHLGEANGIMRAYENQLHLRCLYLIRAN